MKVENGELISVDDSEIDEDGMFSTPFYKIADGCFGNSEKLKTFMICTMSDRVILNVDKLFNECPSLSEVVLCFFPITSESDCIKTITRESVLNDPIYKLEYGNVYCHSVNNTNVKPSTNTTLKNDNIFILK